MNENDVKITDDLPSPSILFGEKENESHIIRNDGISERIPQYRLVERKQDIWFFILTIVLVLGFLVKISNIQIYSMQSSSMESVIPEGSLVIVRKIDPADIQIDDVITFVSSHGVSVTHQVVMIEKDADGFIAFRTQGADNDRIDSDVVTIGQYRGKVIRYIPGIGKIFNIRKYFH